MITAGAFVVLAAAGAVGRAEAGRRWNRHDGFPLGTLLVNVSGALALGMLSEATSPVMTAVGVGGLGAYTTFSSLARDLVALVEVRQAALSALYLGLTAVLGVGAAWAGMQMAG